VKNRNILVSGASIAGPALAFWLRRHGFNPTVVERAPGPRPGGQAVDLRGAGRDAAERMGITAAIRRAHTGVRGMAFVDAANRKRVTMPADLFGDSGGIVAEIEILRGDLVQILYSVTRDDVEYLFDDSITGLVQRDHGVEVTFRRAEPRVFDLVVGADGLHSNVRALAFGPESEFVRDLGYHLAIFGAAAGLDLDSWELMYTAPPGRMVGLYPVRNYAQARAMFFFTSPPLEIDGRDVGQQKRLLAERFAGVGWEVPRLLEAMWEAPDFYFDRASRVQMASWSSERAVLLGDAGYGGSVGMGTSMALVGAYVLAGELAGAAGDHLAGFARYESEMREYVAQNLKPIPGGVRGFLPQTRLEVWLRNQFMRMLPHLPSKGPMGGIERAANAITLKAYPAATAIGAASEI
jgi:2-polyprenyl-6-methoxyphenol hydroxylase-like FAD-dependent oxidoreductase